MAAWSSRGLRGSTLEEMINLTNESYRDKGLALIQKVPTPITPIKIDSASRTITLAYFEKKSTVDYIGAVQGIPVCFDAKETTLNYLPLQNIHAHQIQFMADFEKQGGLAFLIVSYRRTGEYFCVPFPAIEACWNEAQNGGRKSIPYEKLDKGLLISNKSGFLLHYLEAVAKMLAHAAVD